MNELLLNELIEKYLENFKKHFENNASSKPKKPKKSYSYDSWLDTRLKVSFLNSTWQRFLTSNGIIGNYKIECAVKLHTKIIVLHGQIFKRSETVRMNSCDDVNELSDLEIIANFFSTEVKRLRKETLENESNNLTISTSKFGISWKKETTSKTLGYKTDLKELLFVLYKSERIIKNKKPIEHKELTRIFNELLGTDVNLENPSDKINRRSLDKTYINELNEIMNEHLLKNPEK